jgi:hypothetical protein
VVNPTSSNRGSPRGWEIRCLEARSDNFRAASFSRATRKLGGRIKLPCNGLVLRSEIALTSRVAA